MNNTLSDIYSKTFIIESVEDIKEENNSIIDKSLMDKTVKDDITRKSFLDAEDSEYKTIINYKKEENVNVISEIKDDELDLK